MTSHFGLAFESLIQINSNYYVLSCISQNTLILPCHCMHHIVAYRHVMIVFRCVLRGRFCLRGYSRVSNWRAVSHYHFVRQATPLITPIQTHLLASALVYRIKTTRFKLLCVAVVEPTSSAWPVIATVTRWNPLACVGVDSAMFVFPTMLCLESCQVWLIGWWTRVNGCVGNESEVLNMIW